jgi:hypothetical protein
VLATDIKSSVDAAEEEQHLKDQDMTASETNSTPVRPFADVRGNMTISAQSFPLLKLPY